MEDRERDKRFLSRSGTRCRPALWNWHARQALAVRVSDIVSAFVGGRARHGPGSTTQPDRPIGRSLEKHRRSSGQSERYPRNSRCFNSGLIDNSRTPCRVFAKLRLLDGDAELQTVDSGIGMQR